MKKKSIEDIANKAPKRRKGSSDKSKFNENQLISDVPADSLSDESEQPQDVVQEKINKKWETKAIKRNSDRRRRKSRLCELKFEKIDKAAEHRAPNVDESITHSGIPIERIGQVLDCGNFKVV